MLNTDQAVVWRGPMLGKAVEQFLYEITWGELDYLIIDLPPGTGDVQLSLAQLVEVDGAIIVTTPQNVALQDASRAASMFQEVKVPVLGVIENMSEFQCPKCGTVTHIFSKNGGEALAAKYKIPKLGGIPISADIMDSGESGKPIVWKDPEGIVAKSYNEIIDKVAIEIQKYR
jgi:ATP-binding protein involved in chromosome partitioning